MQNHSPEIIEIIKQEEEIEDLKVINQFTAEEFVGKIKHEPERHFVFIMPDDPEIDEVKEVKIVLSKFDRTWKKNKPEIFETFSVCARCEYVSRQLTNFYQHLKTCKNLKRCENCFLMSKSEKFEECGMCDLKFECNNCKTKHQNQNHFNGSTWHCSKCESRTTNREYLRKHYQTHVKKFSCETCKKIFAKNREFKNHQQQHRHGSFALEPETKFDCKKCLRSFATKHSLKQHERHFHSTLKFHCDICGKTTKTKFEILVHIQTHFKVPCPICQRRFAERLLKGHIEEHSISANFKCDQCEKVYFNMKSLNHHKKAKHEINEVQCDFCSKVFKNKLLIRRHMTNHLKVPCSICTKSITKQSLKQHMKSSHSSGEKHLACNIQKCQQKFKNIKELKDYEKIHIVTRVYKCPKCEYRTKRIRDIKSHMTRRHKT